MCANPHVIMCFDNLRNHTGGRSFHRLRDYQAYQDKLLVRSVMNILYSISKHITTGAAEKVEREVKAEF